MTNLVSVIIVNYNKQPYTELCLRSLLQTDYEPFEIIAIDNGSTDGTVETLREIQRECADRSMRCELILNDSNVGACTARNQGMEIARGGYMSFMDNDVAVRGPKWMTKLRAALDEADDIAICGPKLVFPFAPYDIEFGGCEVSPNGRIKYRGRGEPYAAPEYNERREVQCLISATWLMKARLVQEIGVLDEVFNPAQYEDLDYCYRARERGYRILYEPSAELYHFESVTTDGSVNVNYRYITIKNGLEFKRRWQHVFSHENGPPDSECQWRQLETRPLAVTGPPPIASDL
jgi:GT2 family glycosyltransferase